MLHKAKKQGTFNKRIREAPASRAVLLREVPKLSAGGHVICNARDAGFEMTIVYLFLDSPDTCVERVHERVLKGGHSVPEADIRRRFFRSIANFWWLYRPLADHWLLVYNSGNQPFDVAAGTAEQVSVRDAELYATFTRWTEGGNDG